MSFTEHAPDLPLPGAVEMPWPTIHLGVGNSDNKLTQREWADFLSSLNDLVFLYTSNILGWWYSGPAEPWQNACVAFTLNPLRRTDFRAELVTLRKQYQQDSVAWAESETEFI